VSNLLLAQVADGAREQNKSTCDRFKSVLSKMQERPSSTEALFELQNYIKDCDAEIEELSKEIRAAGERLALLDTFSCDTSSDDMQLFWTAFAWPKQVMSAKRDSAPKVEEDRLKFMGELQSLQQAFVKELGGYEADIDLFQTYSNVDNAEEYSDSVVILNTKLAEASDTAALINSREELFGFPVTQFEDIKRLQKDFEPFASLWTMAAECNKAYPEWMYGPFIQLNPEDIDKDVQKWWKMCYKAEKAFEDKVAPKGVATALKTRLEEFRANIPLLTSLRNPGLRDRHWAQLSEAIGVELRPDPSLTLKYLLELDIAKHETIITSISDVAAKEYSFERALDKMRGEWSDVFFEIKEYRDSGTFVVRGVDDIMVVLDDQIVKIQAMRGSPFVKPLERQVVDWNGQLIYMQEVLEEWLKCQKTWLYLEPIFSSPDIMRQMPQEARRFAAVDKMWRTTLEAAHKDSKVLAVMAIEGIKNNFVEANKLLEQVQKGLNDYLETKRAAFPRFYFLSNDELLDILSETKDPKRVVPHLPKCFENIVNVDFEPNQDITAMRSTENERVAFVTKISPDSEKNRGNVERWLIEVRGGVIFSLSVQLEASMRSSLKDTMAKAGASYSQTVPPPSQLPNPLAAACQVRSGLAWPDCPRHRLLHLDPRRRTGAQSWGS
jgi:dynein heavy chain, axonemal